MSKFKFFTETAKELSKKNSAVITFAQSVTGLGIGLRGGFFADHLINGPNNPSTSPATNNTSHPSQPGS